jgi:hypothetical protein
MRTSSTLARVIYFFTWLLYCAAVLYLDWTNAQLSHVLLGLLAFIGAAVALGWVAFPGRTAYACLLLSFVIVISYCVWWGSQVLGRHAAEPSIGLIRELGLQGSMWALMFEHSWSAGNYLGALAQAYWNFGMALTQILFGPVIAVGLSNDFSRRAKVAA